MRFRPTTYCFLCSIAVCLLVICCATSATGQKFQKQPAIDSVQLKSGFALVLKDTFYLSERDTVIILPKGTAYKVKPSPYFKSDRFYDSLKSKAANTEITRKLFSLLFRSASSDISQKKTIAKGEEVFFPFRNKRIGEITIVRAPILEGSVQDTTRKARSWYGKWLNKMHFHTREKIIKENVLFNTGEKVDPYQLADTERILRQLRTIRDARIYLVPRIDQEDVVDVKIVTQDVISLGASLDYSRMNNFGFSLYDRNILGYARDLQLSYLFYEHGRPKHGYALQYRVPNFWGTFIRGQFRYENSHLREQLAVELNRNFFVPEIKYGGGVTLQSVSQFYLPVSAHALSIPYTKNEGSFWLGRSYQLRKRDNMILQARFSKTEYQQRPHTTIDTNRVFMSNNIIYLNAAFISRTYSKTKLLKGFGRTEDIAKGRMASITYAFDRNEFYDRHYWQLKAGFADYFRNVGYFSFMGGIGAFKNSDGWEDGAFNSVFNYFSPLIKAGRSSLRQFLNISYTAGIHRRSERELIIENKFYTDTNLRPLGDKRFSAALETVYFTPLYFYGCKLSFYSRNSFNWLSFNELIDSKKFYSSFGLGVRILNESFVFPTIEMNFTYFRSPGNYPDDTQFRIFNSYPVNFEDFQIGRPEVLPY